jgi:hypothetical protein
MTVDGAEGFCFCGRTPTSRATRELGGGPCRRAQSEAARGSAHAGAPRAPAPRLEESTFGASASLRSHAEGPGPGPLSAELSHSRSADGRQAPRQRVITLSLERVPGGLPKARAHDGRAAPTSGDPAETSHRVTSARRALHSRNDPTGLVEALADALTSLREIAPDPGGEHRYFVCSVARAGRAL